MHLHWIFSAFKKLENKSSTIPSTLCTKNEWSNFNEYIVAMEKEWDENNIREITKLIEQYEQT